MSHSLTFLGTGAADPSPLLQTEYRDRFSRDLRRCSALLIDGSILIDCGPHVPGSLSILGIDPAGITDLFITHFHGDHVNRETLDFLAERAPGLRVHYRADANPSLPKGVVPCPMTLFSPDETAGVRVTGYPANHQAHPQVLDFAFPDFRFLYATDGAWFLGDTVRAMQDARYDAVCLDATCGDYLGDYRMGEHNSIPMIRVMVPSMRTLNILKDESRIILTHLATTLHKSYADTAQKTKGDGFTVAYDGMTLTI